jgi:hypothetical protein
MLIKVPFKNYKGAKHCVVCLKYIHPSSSNYEERLYCEDEDDTCQQIALLLRKLKPLCEKRRIGYKSILTRNIADTTLPS